MLHLSITVTYTVASESGVITSRVWTQVDWPELRKIKAHKAEDLTGDHQNVGRKAGSRRHLTLATL